VRHYEAVRGSLGDYLWPATSSTQGSDIDEGGRSRMGFFVQNASRFGAIFAKELARTLRIKMDRRHMVEM
jgi:hypothetical protein